MDNFSYLSYLLEFNAVDACKIPLSVVFQDSETVAMLVYQFNPVGVQLFSYVNSFCCSNKSAWLLDTWVKMTPEVNLSIEYENEENIIILLDLHSTRQEKFITRSSISGNW